MTEMLMADSIYQPPQFLLSSVVSLVGLKEEARKVRGGHRLYREMCPDKRRRSDLLLLYVAAPNNNARLGLSVAL